MRWLWLKFQMTMVGITNPLFSHPSTFILLWKHRHAKNTRLWSRGPIREILSHPVFSQFTTMFCNNPGSYANYISQNTSKAEKFLGLPEVACVSPLLHCGATSQQRMCDGVNLLTLCSKSQKATEGVRFPVSPLTAGFCTFQQFYHLLIMSSWSQALKMWTFRGHFRSKLLHSPIHYCRNWQ